MFARFMTRRRERTFLRNESGATAVEFALVAAPFIALLVGIMQTFLVFFAGQQMQTLVSQSSRMILTGQAQDNHWDQSAFTQNLCNRIVVLFTCGNIMIDVQAYSSFSAASTGAPTLTYDASGHVNNTWQYNPGNPGQIVVVRAMYLWPVFLGPLGFNLANQSNNNRLIMASAVFKNEPFK